MLYTIGNRLNYLSTFRKMAAATDGFHHKGEGGYALRTIEEARRLSREQFPTKDMAIFGIYAEWEIDTSPVDPGWWHVLKHSAPIVMLDPRGHPIEWPEGTDEAPDLCRA